MKRSLIILLIASILLPCIFAGCNTTPAQSTTPDTPTPESTTPEVTTPDENDEPVVEPPYEGPDLTSDNVLKRADVITTGTTESELYAVEELTKYLGYLPL